MICPECQFNNRKGTLACGRCGATTVRPLNATIDTRPPADGPRSAPGLRRDVPINRRGGGLRAFGGGPANSNYPMPRVRPAPPRWERGSRAGYQVTGDATVSKLSEVRTDPQWLVSPGDQRTEQPESHTDDPAVESPPAATLPRTTLFAPRAVAAAIDTAVVLLATACSLALATGVFGYHRLVSHFGRGFDYVFDGLLVGRGLAFQVFGLMLVLGFVYTTVSHALGGATLGKALLGLRVVTRDGEAPQPGESAARSVLAGLSFALAGIGVAVAVVDPKHIALHDRIVGTRVVRPKPRL